MRAKIYDTKSKPLYQTHHIEYFLYYDFVSEISFLFFINSDKHNPTLSPCLAFVCTGGVYMELALNKKTRADGTRAVLNYVILVRCQLYNRHIIFTYCDRLHL